MPTGTQHTCWNTTHLVKVNTPVGTPHACWNTTLFYTTQHTHIKFTNVLKKLLIIL